jgi:cytosine/adenosine deaminase-related metal-dependent hydrolase
LSVGCVADLTVWSLDGPSFAGALSDPIEAWLRCGPLSATHTIINGVPVVEDGALTIPGLDDRLARHRAAAARIQQD